MKLILILVLILVFIVTSLLANVDTSLHELQTLSPTQKQIMLKTFSKGKKYDLEYTLTAICWEESQFGKYLVNISDPSFGYFHNSIKTIQHRYRSNNWNTSRLAERLIFDFDFGFEQALIELKFWQNVYKDKPLSWSNTVKSYNAGFNNINGVRYLEQIKIKIKALRKYFELNKNNITVNK